MANGCLTQSYRLFYASFEKLPYLTTNIFIFEYDHQTLERNWVTQNRDFENATKILFNFFKFFIGESLIHGYRTTLITNQLWYFIVFSGIGGAINKAISTAEVLKTTMTLHQTNTIYFVGITEIWTPKENKVRN